MGSCSMKTRISCYLSGTLAPGHEEALPWQDIGRHLQSGVCRSIVAWPCERLHLTSLNGDRRLHRSCFRRSMLCAANFIFNPCAAFCCNRALLGKCTSGFSKVAWYASKGCGQMFAMSAAEMQHAFQPIVQLRVTSPDIPSSPCSGCSRVSCSRPRSPKP